MMFKSFSILFVLISLSAFAGKYDDVLFQAIRSRDLATLKKIATEAPEIFLKSHSLYAEYSKTALEELTETGLSEVIAIIAQANPKILREGLAKGNAVYKSAERRDAATLKMLATYAPELFSKEIVHYRGQTTPLEELVGNDQADVIALIGQTNPKILVEGLSKRDTVLKVAGSRKIETLKVLATYAPELFSKEIKKPYGDGKTPLECLVEDDHAEVVALIGQSDPKILAQGLEKRNVVNWAVTHRRTATLKVLAKYAPQLFDLKRPSRYRYEEETPFENLLVAKNLPLVREIAVEASPLFMKSLKQQAPQYGWSPEDIVAVEDYVKNWKLFQKELQAVDLVRHFNIIHPGDQGSKNALLLAAAGNNPQVDLSKVLKSVFCQGGGCGCRNFGEMFARVNIAAKYHQHRNYEGASKDGQAQKFTPKAWIDLLGFGSPKNPEVANEIFSFAKNLGRREKLVLYFELSRKVFQKELSEKLLKATLLIQPEENESDESRRELDELKAQILRTTIPFLKLSPKLISKIRDFAEVQPEETRLKLEKLVNSKNTIQKR